MFVVVAFMSGVTAAIVNVIDVITVRHRHMSAARAVGMVVAGVGGVTGGRLALVEVPLVGTMKVPVVHIVDVICVRDRHMPTPLTVNVVVAGVFLMQRSGHAILLDSGVPTFGQHILSNSHILSCSGADC